MQHWYLSVISHKKLTSSPPATFVGVIFFCLSLMSGPTQAQTPLLANPSATGSSAQSPFSQQPAFLDVDQAFAFFISLDGPDTISVHWTIAPGYYLYADKFNFAISGPEASRIALIPVLPAGVKHEDEFFGEVTVYFGQARAVLRLPDNSAEQFTLAVGFQGCAEAGLCYPPTQHNVDITR
jgi:thiol:disulfide interchange protein DsbD